ncbi:hypothetical protein [uncultured Mediterranean phage uvMED]|nr:hypothetical protein [uncultured Mediterranean phage uvMED]
MAYKPTRQRQFGVTPLNVVPATGMKKMASAIGKIADASDAIRQHDRKMRFDQAVLDAELAGKTAVKFDDDNKVIPITSMEYNPGMFYGADEAQVQSVFRKALTQTYKTAFSNDVADAAENAAMNNFANPNGVKAIMEEYGLQVENLPDELKAELKPTFLSAFGRAERHTRAQLIDKTNKEGIASGEKRIKSIFNEIKNHSMLASQIGEPIDANHIDKLQLEIAEISRNLIDNLNVDSGKVDELINTGNTVVHMASTEGHIMREYKANGGDLTLTGLEIDKVMTSLSKADPNLNLNAIESNMRSRLAILEREESDRLKNENLALTESYHGYTFSILNGTITTNEQIESLEDVKRSHKNALRAQLKGVLTGDKAEQASQFNKTVKLPWEDTAKMILADINDKTHSNSKRRQFIKNMEQHLAEGRSLGLLVGSQYASYKKAVESFVVPISKMKMDEKKHMLDFSLSENGGYTVDPKKLLSEEFINGHLKSGLFKNEYDQLGSSNYAAAYTVGEWKTKALDYAKRYKQFHKDATELDIKMKLSRAGAWGSFDNSDLEYLREKVNFGTLSIIDPETNASVDWEDAFFMFDKPDIQQKAMQKLVGLATDHGVFPEKLASVLSKMKNLMPSTDPEKQELVFNSMHRAVSQIHESFKQKHTPDIAEEMTRSLLNFNGIEYGQYTISRAMGFENFTNWNAKKNATQASSRDMSALIPDGMDKNDFFNQSFEHTFQHRGILTKINNGLKFWTNNDHLNAKLRNAVNQIGTSDASFVWGNPEIKKVVMDMTYQWIDENGLLPNRDTMNEGIIASMSKLGNRIGISEIELPEGETIAQVVLDPIYKEAAKSIVPYGDKYVDFTAMFNEDPMKYINQDVKNIYYATTRAGPPGSEPDFDNLVFIPNRVVGQRNTWTVGYYDQDSYELKVALPDYSYDFKNSIHNVAMANAYEATKDATGLSKFFLHSGLFNTRELNKIMEREIDAQLSPYDKTGLMVKFYNNYMASIGSDSTTLIDMADVEPSDASQFIWLLDAIKNNHVPGIGTPYRYAKGAYNLVPDEVMKALTYNDQLKAWEEVKKDIWN